MGISIKNQKSKIKNPPTRSSAFTLIEMLAVMGIILILATMLVPVTLKVQERDQVGQAATVLQGILTQAKSRALREGKNIGIRLKPRIRQGEIPSDVRTALGTNADVDQDGQITFADLNHYVPLPIPAWPNQAGGKATHKFLANDGWRRADAADEPHIVVPRDLYYDLLGPGSEPTASIEYGQGGSWVNGNYAIATAPENGDDDLSGFPDDIVVADEFELIEQPGDFRDGWVWTPFFSAPATTRTMPQLAYDVGLPAQFNPVINGFPPYYGPPTVTVPNHVLPGGVLWNQTLFGPYDASWPADPGPTIATSSTFGTQRSCNFHSAFLRQEIQIDDYVEIHGLGQLYRIARVDAPRAAVINVSPAIPPLPASLLLDRPVSGEVHVPRNGLSNYRIIRQPRPIAGQPTTRLPANVVINLNPLGQGDTIGTIRMRDNQKQVYLSGLTYGIPLDTFNMDIVFSPSGQVVNTTADVIYLWLVDTSAGNNDNQILVAIYTRTGKVATYPVEQIQGGDPYAHARIGRAQGG